MGARPIRVFAAAVCTIVMAIQLPVFATVIEVEKRTHTYSGIPLETPISIEVKGRFFDIPAGYFWGWPGRDFLNKVNHYSGFIVIHFWMPSKHYPEFSGVSVPDLRPKMKGEPHDPAAYVVQANIEIQKIGEPHYVSPWQRSLNAMFPYKSRRWQFETTPFGLQHFWPDDREPNDRVIYRNFEGLDPQNATLPHQRPRNLYAREISIS